MRRCDRFLDILYHVVPVCMGLICVTASLLYHTHVFLLWSTATAWIWDLPPQLLLSLLTILTLLAFNCFGAITFIKWCPYIYIILLLNHIYLILIRRLASSWPSLTEFVNRVSRARVLLAKCATYRAFSVLLNFYNNFLSGIIIWHKFMIILNTSIGFAISLIVQSAPSLSLSMAGCSSLLLLVLVTDFTLAGSLFEQAKTCKNKLEKCSAFHFPSPGKGKFKKYILENVAALRPLRIRAGEHYSLHKGVVPIILDVVMQTTSTIVLTFKKVANQN